MSTLLPEESMGAKHTDGPWRIEKRYSNGCEVGPWIMAERESDGKRRIIATIGGAPYLEDDGGENTYANARLIAAAPDLYEVCRDIYQDGLNTRIMTKLLTALVKAEEGGGS